MAAVTVLKVIGWILLAVVLLMFVMLPLKLIQLAMIAPHHYPRTVVVIRRRHW
jgi:hypothetical protein